MQIAYCVRVSGCLFGKHSTCSSLAFVVVFALADHICRVFFRRLESLGLFVAPNARDWSHVWSVEHINKNPADESAGFL